MTAVVGLEVLFFDVFGKGYASRFFYKITKFNFAELFFGCSVKVGPRLDSSEIILNDVGYAFFSRFRRSEKPRAPLFLRKSSACSKRALCRTSLLSSHNFDDKYTHIKLCRVHVPIC